MNIIVDTREPKQNYQFLSGAFPQHNFELKALPEGDYASNTVIVERKTIADLYGSIRGSREKPGRLVSQVGRLSSHEEILVLLVIGSITDFLDSMKRLNVQVDVNVIYGAIASLSCREHIHLIWVANEWDGLLTMVKFMQKIEDGNYKIPSQRDPDILMARYLKLTLKQFKALKGKFGTIRCITEATDKDLMAIEGIGKTKAKNIRLLLTEGW